MKGLTEMLRALTTGLIFATAVMLTHHGAAGAVGTPTYPCFRAPQPPVIDGVIEGDAAWDAVPGASGFYVLGGGYTIAKQTTAFACYDDEHLYVAMLCEEPDIDLLKSVMKDGDDLWTEDSVEVFVEPVAGGLVYQFAVSAGGAPRGAEAATGLAGWEAAAHKGEEAYGIEMRLPFAAFEAAPPAAQAFRVAFCRNIWTYASGGDKFTSWPALSGRFREPTSFATLSFHPATPTTAQRQQAETVLNAGYREHLMRQVVALAPAAAEYMPVLKLAAADEDSKLREEAREVIRQWRRVERLASTASEAPLKRLREAAGRSSALTHVSYELKYRYLLEQLLRDI